MFVSRSLDHMYLSGKVFPSLLWSAWNCCMAPIIQCARVVSGMFLYWALGVQLLIVRKSFRASPSTVSVSNGWDPSDFSWKSPYVLRLVPGDLELKWFLGKLDPDNLTAALATGNMWFSTFFGMRTSFALNLRAWIATMMSPTHILGRVLTGLWQTWDDILSSNQMELLVLGMVLQIAVSKVFSRPIRGAVLNVSQITETFHFSSKPDCNSVAEVLSQILRTTISAPEKIREWEQPHAKTVCLGTAKR